MNCRQKSCARISPVPSSRRCWHSTVSFASRRFTGYEIDDSIVGLVFSIKIPPLVGFSQNPNSNNQKAKTKSKAKSKAIKITRKAQNPPASNFQSSSSFLTSFDTISKQT
jgi:hypothetical protein